MTHDDHVALLRGGIPGPGGVWADLGSGAGAFTLALADLLGPAARIYSVDRDSRALLEQERAMRARFPDRAVAYRVADFTRPLDVPRLDGAVMANALHFQRHPVSVAFWSALSLLEAAPGAPLSMPSDDGKTGQKSRMRE